MGHELDALGRELRLDFRIAEHARRRCVLPLPEEPKLSSPGCALAYAISSCTEFTGSDEGTTSRNRMRATSVTGTRSVSGSNEVALAMYGLITKTLSGASNHV